MKTTLPKRSPGAEWLAVGLVMTLSLAACSPRGASLIEAEPLVTRLAPTVAVPSAPATLTESINPPTAFPTQTPEPTATLAPAVRWSEIDPAGQTVVFWHPFTYTRTEALLRSAAEFNRTNPWGILVRAEQQGDSGDLYDATLAVLNTPQAPNLVLAFQDQAVAYQRARGLVDINGLLNDSVWGLPDVDRQDFFAGVWAQDVYPAFGGARLGFPAYRSMDVLYYNADWLADLKAAGTIDFEGPPVTPDQFEVAACAAVDSPFRKASGERAMGYQISISASRFASWTFAFGGELYDAPTNRYLYDSTAAVQAMQLIQRLFLKGCATFAAANFGDQADFGQGSLLFAVGTSSGLPFYEEAVDEGARFEWDVVALPHTGRNPAQNVYGPSVSILKSTPEAELAAWLFLKHLTSVQSQADWAIASGYFPVRSGAAPGLAQTFRQNPRYQRVFEMLPFGKFEPPTPGYQTVRALVEEALAAIASGADVSAALAALNERANAVLHDQLNPPGTSPLTAPP